MTLHHVKRLALGAVCSLTMTGLALADGNLPGEGVTVRPVEGTNLEEKFQHKIIYRALEELGYTVADPQEVEYQTMHLALGSGDGDFTAVHSHDRSQCFFRVESTGLICRA